VNCGAKHSCYNAILAVVNPGEEVIIPAPYWTSYPEMVKLAGGVPVVVETKAENGWKMTPGGVREQHLAHDQDGHHQLPRQSDWLCLH